MKVAQMLAHCCGPLEVYFEEKKAKRDLMGLLFGKIVFKQLIGNKSWKRGLPIVKEFKIKEVKKFEEEKYNLVNSVNGFSTQGYTITSYTHTFFGKLSAQEYALFNYRHLQQFGV